MKKKHRPWLGLVLLDLFLVGFEMGVPVLNILLGFVVGWYIVDKAGEAAPGERLYRWIFSQAMYTTIPMLVMLGLIWGWTVMFLFDPGYDFTNFGHPFILFDPKASFIAWLVLMVLISPALRLLTTVFGGFLRLVYQEGK